MWRPTTLLLLLLVTPSLVASFGISSSIINYQRPLEEPASFGQRPFSSSWQRLASAISSDSSSDSRSMENSRLESSASSQSSSLTSSTISKISASNNSPSSYNNNNNNNALAFDWKSVVDHVWESSSRPIVLFDGHCNLCNGAVCFCLDWDSSAQFRFASLQSKVGQSLLVQTGRSPYDLSSIVLVTSPTNSYRESDAVLRICQKLQGSPVWPVLGWAGLGFPRFVRDAVYKVVAKNRHRFMEDMCRIDLDGEYHDRFVHDEDHVQTRITSNTAAGGGGSVDATTTETK